LIGVRSTSGSSAKPPGTARTDHHTPGGLDKTHLETEGLDRDGLVVSIRTDAAAPARIETTGGVR
jgi:hypothetical protein